MKDYYPINIEMLHNEINDDVKIQNMIHQNFCKYLNKKGKNKNKFCLNKFKDINELRYCATHRYELKPDIKCEAFYCNSKTKQGLCKKCKAFYNKPIPKIKLPPPDDDEKYLLNNFDNLLMEYIYPNALYTIKHYDRHKYYKNTIVKINLILPKYNENGIKIKTIKKGNYIIKYNNVINIITKFKIKGEINHYNTYINDIFEKNNIYGIICFMKIFNNKFRNFISLDKACNVPLPPVTNDEEILLNLNNLQENLKKPIWEENENKKHNDAHQCVLKCCLCKSNEAMDICFECWDEQQSRYRYIGSFHDKGIQCNLLNTTLNCGNEIIYEKGNMSYYHFINKKDNIIFKGDENMQLIVYNEFGYEATNHYINCRLKKYIKNKKKNNKKKDKKIKEKFYENIKKDITLKDIEKDDEKTYCLNMELKIVNRKYGLNFDFIDKEIKNLMEERNKLRKENRKPSIILMILQKINEIFNRKVNKEIADFICIVKRNKALYDKYHILIDSFIKDLKYLLKFYINDYNYFENNFKSLTFGDD